MDEDAILLEEDTITTQNPDETIRASDYPQTNALELTSFLVMGGISMQETRDTLKRIKKPRNRLLSVEQDLAQDLSVQLDSLQSDSFAEPGDIVKRNSI
jgi:hypothetical protein